MTGSQNLVTDQRTMTEQLRYECGCRMVDCSCCDSSILLSCRVCARGGRE